MQTFLTALPGLAAVGALIFTWVSISATTDATNHQLQITEQGQITDRYNAAVTNLGSLSVDVRLGGIYALQRIMQDSSRDQPTVVAVLSAFVRDQAKAATTPSAPPTSKKAATPSAISSSIIQAAATPPAPPTDIQAAVTVVATRNISYDGSTIVDFTGAHLAGAQLENAHLNGAQLSGTDLSKAYLSGAHLDKADLIGAHLDQAHLDQAHLSKANLAFAYLTEADLTGAHLEGALLIGAHLEGVIRRLPKRYSLCVTSLEVELASPAGKTPVRPAGGSSPQTPPKSNCARCTSCRPAITTGAAGPTTAPRSTPPRTRSPKS
jgi:hypothetical protein